MMDTKTSYEEKRAEIKADQEKKSYEKIKAEMDKKSEFTLEMDRLPGQLHNWVDRGTHFSCEGAMHDNHRASKRRG